MYELRDTHAEALLAADAARGVKVRVVLDQNLERARNTAAYDFLSSHGVAVAWAPSRYAADHEKALVVDRTTAWVMTGNLVSWDYPNTRDFAVRDTTPSDVAAIEATFTADFSGRPVSPSPARDLVWSPTNSTSSIVGLIDSARHAIWAESEELSSPDVVDALLAALHRGVGVYLVMNDDPRYVENFTRLVAAGGHVATYPGDPGLYIHTKAVVVDPASPEARAFVGSENFSTASLDYNRELGVITADPQIVGGIASTLFKDYAGGTPWAS